MCRASHPYQCKGAFRSVKILPRLLGQKPSVPVPCSISLSLGPIFSQLIGWGSTVKGSEKRQLGEKSAMIEIETPQHEEGET